MTTEWLRVAGLASALCASAAAQISGRVVANGGPPPDRAWVTIHCEGSGTWTWVGYADRRGEFLSASPDTRANFSGDDEYGTCEVTANVRGFLPALVRVSRTHADVLVTLQPLAPGDQASVSYAELSAPPAARKLLARGIEDARALRWKESETSLRKAIAAYPGYAGAWGELGRTLERSGTPDQAAEAYRQAIKLDGRNFPAYARLAVLEAGVQHWDRVAALTADAIARRPPGWAVLFFYHAVANYNLGHLDVAEASARKAAAEGFPRAHYTLGRILADRGDSRGAADEMSKYLELLPNAADEARVRAEIAAARAK
jgi:tetratricopeptide (TPR) repeat protein